LFESILVKLHAVNKSADYELFDEDSGKKAIKKGEELLNGIKISLSEKQTSLLFNYKEIKMR